MFRSAFPFHVTFARDLCIVDEGPALATAAGRSLIGADFARLFRVLRPRQVATFDAMLAAADSAFVAELVGSELVLCGQMLELEPGRAVFLCAPWPVELSDLEGLGLPQTVLHVDAVSELRARLHGLATDLAPNVVSSIIAAYLREAPLQLAKLERVCAEQDAPGVERAAHGLRSAAATIGAVGLATLCATVERHAKDGAAVSSTLPQLKLELQAVLGELGQLATGYPPPSMPMSRA